MLHRGCDSPSFLISHSFLAFHLVKNSGYVLPTSSFLTVTNNFFLFYLLLLLFFLHSSFLSPLYTPGITWSELSSSSQQPEDFRIALCGSYSSKFKNILQNIYKDKGSNINKNRFWIFFFWKFTNQDFYFIKTVS